MTKFQVDIQIPYTYIVEAEDEGDAEVKALEMCLEEIAHAGPDDPEIVNVRVIG